MSNDLEILRGLARLEAGQESMKSDIQSIKDEDMKQNQLLAEHIAGVQTNRASLVLERQMRQEALVHHEEQSQKRYEDLEGRLKIVEFLPNVLTGLWKIVKWVGMFAAVAVSIAKFSGLF